MTTDALTALRSMTTIGDNFTCERGPECTRCHGCGVVCEAHPHTPRTGLVRESCTCGAAGMPCRTARRMPVVIDLRVGKFWHRIPCRTAESCTT